MDFNTAMIERSFISAIPKDVAEVFEETDIEKTWDYLERVFKLNKKHYKPEFEKVYKYSSRQYSKQELFVRYGKEHFEPAINTILGRDRNHSTWINLIRFMVWSKIVEKQNERDEQKKFYRRPRK